MVFSLKPDQVPIQTLDSFGLCFQLFRILNDDLKEPFLVENFRLINGSELFHSHFEGLALGFVHRCVQVFFLGMLFGRGIRPLSFQVHESSLWIHFVHVYQWGKFLLFEFAHCCPILCLFIIVVL